MPANRPLETRASSRPEGISSRSAMQMMSGSVDSCRRSSHYPPHFHNATYSEPAIHWSNPAALRELQLFEACLANSGAAHSLVTSLSQLGLIHPFVHRV